MTDVVVIGAGACGLAVALELSRRTGEGSIQVVDAREPGYGGSGRAAGGLRRQGRVTEELTLAGKAFDYWMELAERLGASTEFRRTGTLLVASGAEHVADLVAKFERQRGSDVASELLGPRGVAEVCPWLRDDLTLGLYCAGDAQFNPPTTIRTFAEHVAAAGVEMVTGHHVTGLRRSGERWIVESADGFAAEADTVVIAAGEESAELLSLVDVRLPILACRVATILTEPVDEEMPVFVQDWDAQLFVRQRQNGAIQTGHLGQDFISVGHGVTDEEEALIRRSFSRSMPGVGLPATLSRWGGIIDESRDRRPIVGGFDGMDGLIVAAGWSGHGYLLAPYVGALIARYVCDGAWDPDLLPFSPVRFRISEGTSNVDA